MECVMIIVGIDAHILQEGIGEPLFRFGIINLVFKNLVLDTGSNGCALNMNGDVGGPFHCHTITATIDIAKGTATKFKVSLVKHWQIINGSCDYFSIILEIGHLIFIAFYRGVFIVSIATTKDIADKDMMVVGLITGTDKGIILIGVLIYSTSYSVFIRMH